MAKSRVIDRDRGFAQLMQTAAGTAHGARCKVGILGGDDRGGLHERDPATGKASPLTVAEIAVVQEFGTEDGHIPARSFVRSTFDHMQQELADDAKALLAKIADGNMTIERALNLLGLKLATAIKLYIATGEGVPPPNAPSTIARKGSARPLVDTGRMINALSWSVVIDGVEKAHNFLTGGK